MTMLATRKGGFAMSGQDFARKALAKRHGHALPYTMVSGVPRWHVDGNAPMRVKRPDGTWAYHNSKDVVYPSNIKHAPGGQVVFDHKGFTVEVPATHVVNLATGKRLAQKQPAPETGNATTHD
jgi:hypothetical protein